MTRHPGPPSQNHRAISAEVLSLFELDVEEAVCGLLTLVHILHHGVRLEDLLAVDEQGDGRLLPQLHPLADQLLELNGLEVVWN